MARLYGFLFLFMNDYMGYWWLMSLEATMWSGCDSFEERVAGEGEIKIIKMKFNS